MQGWVAQVVVAAVCGGKRAMVPFIQQGVLNGGYGCHFVVPFLEIWAQNLFVANLIFAKLGYIFFFLALLVA